MRVPMSFLHKWIIQRLAVRQEAYEDLVSEMAQGVLELQDEGYLHAGIIYGEDTYMDLTDLGQKALHDIDEGRL